MIGVHGFKLPFYPGDTLLLSYAKDPRVERLFKDPATRPDVLHCSSPGALIWTACGLSDKYKVPLVQSYHTHIPHYIPRYTWAGLVKPMWDFIRYWTGKSDLTMVTSSILQDELRGEGCPRLQVWQKGVDTVAFNPTFRSEEMHDRLCGGRPGKVIGCVGRLGAEKNLKALKTILEGCPEGTNLALIGDGPERAALEEHFEGTNTTFTGMLLGDDLAAAYASLDVFVMPSESETLGFVVMEAMASGVPVVAVRAGGLQDILTNTPEVGQLYPSNDYAEAARLTTELLTDEKEWTRQRGTCRDAVEEWSWMASNRKLRDAQYPMATRRFDRNQRIRIFVDLVASRRRAAEAIGLLMESQWFAQGASFLLAVGALASARLALGDASVVPEGGVGLLGAIQNAARATGPFAPAVMASAIAFASRAAFVPTQPLFALSGLMFGATEGAVISLVGALEAAAIAFAFIRQQGVGRVANVLAGTVGIGAFASTGPRSDSARRTRRRGRHSRGATSQTHALPPRAPRAVHRRQLPPRPLQSVHGDVRRVHDHRIGAVVRVLRAGRVGWERAGGGRGGGGRREVGRGGRGRLLRHRAERGVRVEGVEVSRRRETGGHRERVHHRVVERVEAKRGSEGAKAARVRKLYLSSTNRAVAAKAVSLRVSISAPIFSRRLRTRRRTSPGDDWSVDSFPSRVARSRTSERAREVRRRLSRRSHVSRVSPRPELRVPRVSRAPIASSRSSAPQSWEDAPRVTGRLEQSATPRDATPREARTTRWYPFHHWTTRRDKTLGNTPPPRVRVSGAASPSTRSRATSRLRFVSETLFVRFRRVSPSEPFAIDVRRPVAGRARSRRVLGRSIGRSRVGARVETARDLLAIRRLPRPRRVACARPPRGRTPPRSVRGRPVAPPIDAVEVVDGEGAETLHDGHGRLFEGRVESGAERREVRLRAVFLGGGGVRSGPKTCVEGHGRGRLGRVVVRARGRARGEDARGRAGGGRMR